MSGSSKRKLSELVPSLKITQHFKLASYPNLDTQSEARCSRSLNLVELRTDSNSSAVIGGIRSCFMLEEGYDDF